MEADDQCLGLINTQVIRLSFSQLRLIDVVEVLGAPYYPEETWSLLCVDSNGGRAIDTLRDMAITSHNGSISRPL